jgi:hypothetical protein
MAVGVLPKALYAAYFSGSAGSSMGLFFIGDGIIAGIDVGTVSYDGSYAVNASNGSLEGLVEFTIPANGSLITGVSGGDQPIKIPVRLNLPANFDDGQIILIETPAGPVNARFERIKVLS